VPRTGEHDPTFGTCSRADASCCGADGNPHNIARRCNPKSVVRSEVSQTKEEKLMYRRLVV
jgi:hypothetical protein